MDRGKKFFTNMLLSMLLFASLLPVVLGPLPVVATPEEVPREKTLIVDIDGRSKSVDPTNWNPFLPGGYQPSWHEVVSEPLFIYNYQNGSYMNWLGTGWEYSEDFKSCTVFLRKGVKWNDGRPFSADDVVFTYKMLLEYPMLLPHGVVKAWVEDVVKIDDYTVEFRLTKPFSRFHGTAAFPCVYIWGWLHMVPKHIWEKVDPTTFKNYPDPVFTGPYRVTSVSETTFIYDRRDDWWGTEVWGIRPAPQRIIWTLHTTDEMAAMAAARHELDSVMDISLSTFVSLKDKNPYMIAWYDELPYAHMPHACERNIIINCMGKYPFTLKEVRRVLSYLTNRTEIVDIAYEGTSAPSRAMFGQTGGMQKWLTAIEDLLEKYEVTEYNPEKAYAIFEDLGFTRGADGVWVTPNGTRLEFTVLTPPWIEVKGYAMVFVEHLKEGGIDTVLKVMEAGPWGDKLAYGDYEASAYWFCPAGTHEPYTYLEGWYHSRYFTPIGEYAPTGGGIGRWKNSTYDEILDEMAPLPEDDPRYLELFREAYEIWLQEMPAIPLTLSRKLVPFDTFYWVGWPTAKDPYVSPFTWTGYGLRVPLVEKLRPSKVEYVTVYFAKHTPRSYRGIDLVWYGPFKSGDATRVPEDDAEWYIRTGYASYTAPPPIVPTIPTETIEGIASDVSSVKADVSSVKADVSSVKADMTSLSDKTGALAGQMGTLTAAAAIEGIAIIVLAVALIVVRRK